MRTTITAWGNERTRTYDIVKTWSDGTSVTYRTVNLSDQEFFDMEYNTPGDWQNFLNTSQDYFEVK